MNKIIVILGQTSTGKSDFAVEVAKNINGEIISADSRQVYKGMNLGTGKITKKEMWGIPHYLLDITSPSRVFSVSDFQKLANKKIKEILEKGKTPIICGGTGFYIDSIINRTIFPEVPPNKKLREILERKTTEKLLEILKKIDKNRAQNIDQKNRIRLIRAIEIVKTLGKVPSLSPRPCLGEDKYLKIGLTMPPEVLKERIKTRLLIRIKKGMIKEVENLHNQGVSWKRMNALGLEYRYVSNYLKDSKTMPPLKLRQAKKEMIEKLNTEIWHYAKRQKTWFKRDFNTIWIDPRKKSEKNKALKEIKRFLK
ncbi:MAG: tRNA (adenosine(37)-N6)-dimethylallyltransferase MiaA [Candidatus Paceibacterota bacterium]